MRSIKLHTLLIIVLASFMTSANVFGSGKESKQFTVVIDAGHGGKDFGATDNGGKEKDINLGVALQLENLIKKKLKDVKVVLTRKDDTYLTLQQRADVANKEKGDLFISIHTNSVDKSNKNRKTVAGSSVYALGLHKDESNMKVARRENSVIELENNYEQKYSGFDPNKDESYIIFEMAQKKNLSKSIRFAEAAQKELVNSGRKNRGVHQAGFWVLWATSMPAVLVELDFICNPTSAEYMISPKGEKELAEALFNAFKKYYESWSSASGRNISQSAEDVPQVESSGSEEKVESQQNDEVETEGYAMKLLPSEKKKRTDVPAARKPQGNVTGRRKRRNETSKAASDSRNVETALIPLHTEKERTAPLVSMVPAEEKESLIPEVTQQEKDKKNNKKNKKEKKAKEKKEKKQRSANAHNAKREKFVKVYKIQILASADLLKQNNPRFCGYSPVSTYKENNLYKYYYGESTDKAEIDKLLIDVKKKIPDAFVVSATKSLGSDKK